MHNSPPRLHRDSPHTGTHTDPLRIGLLLTAAIDVRGTPFLERSDTALRYRDYETALDAWCAIPGLAHICLCESTGYNLAGLQRQTCAGHAVELLSFDARQHTQERGKGYGEFLTLEHALAHSSQLATCDWLLKVVGRYRVRNAARYIAWLRNQTDLDIVCDLRARLSLADSLVVAARPQFIARYVPPAGSRIDDRKGHYAEHALACAIHAAIAEGMRWSMPPFTLHIEGVSGTYNRPLAQGSWSRAKRAFFLSCKRRLLER